MIAVVVGLCYISVKMVQIFLNYKDILISELSEEEKNNFLVIYWLPTIYFITIVLLTIVFRNFIVYFCLGS